ncbi:hypothetical protein [Chitinophaga arvensicola]|uniref:Uncharacterized protein n=1 Tax=Chitinophaga arvensicola TaxID=29529 RepID=A0A1I0R9A6_9BACT|nr:hypothetical protein [Chitinophaga arvensicola]SEW37351.1 hypothetical protein SAMN04488122_2498 [Chitinophaga arvensicola]
MMKFTIVTLLILIAVHPSRSGISNADYSYDVFKPIDSIILMKTSQNIQKLDAAIHQLHDVSKQYDSIKRMIITTAPDA